jgi:hypothetical protein
MSPNLRAQVIDEIFIDPMAVGNMLDVINEVLYYRQSSLAKDAETPELMRRYFDALPAHVQDTAIQWGIGDTEFRDSAFVYFRDNGIPDL